MKTRQMPQFFTQVSPEGVAQFLAWSEKLGGHV